MIKGPRTLADFRLLERLARSGYTTVAIQNLYQRKKEWRSEVTTLPGKLHCAHCFRIISINECLTCGQTFHEGSYNE